MSENDFLQAFNGKLTGVMRWPQLDALWQAIAARGDAGWYVYAVGEAPPEEPLDEAGLERLLGELRTLLERDHGEDYCGIVYADDLAEPSLVKVYDPNNLGASCGSSGMRILPGWVLSTMPPVDLQALMPPPAGRRRWWRRLLRGE
jgi:hypothetical protein